MRPGDGVGERDVDVADTRLTSMKCTEMEARSRPANAFTCQQECAQTQLTPGNFLELASSGCAQHAHACLGSRLDGRGYAGCCVVRVRQLAGASALGRAAPCKACCHEGPQANWLPPLAHGRRL